MRGRWDAGWKSPEAHFRSFQSEADRRLPLVTPHLSHADEVLEIGSSTGYFLDRLHPSVRSVTGVEPSDAYRAFAIARGIETVESVDRLGPRKFDVILLYYVMEHLRDPVGYATSLKQRLTEGGHLLIEVPNVDDALLTVYKVPTFPGFYFQKAHYNNFSHRTLSDVLRRAGYRVQVFPEQRYDLSNHMVWMLEGRPGGHGRFAEILGVEINREGALELASRSRGTPRIANRLLRRVRDYAQVRSAGKIDLPTAQAALQMLEVDRYGFDEVDRKLLLAIIEKYQGGPVGVNTLAAALAEEPDAIEEIYEPFLIQIGFLNRTPRGRVATQLAYEHFGITPNRRQSSLF